MEGNPQLPKTGYRGTGLKITVKQKLPHTCYFVHLSRTNAWK